MTEHKRTRVRLLGLVSLSLVIAAITFGFAEANTVHSAGVLGSGYGVKSPYKVSKINYVLDLEDPNKFVAVDFELEEEVGLINAGVSTSGKGKVIWADDCELASTRWTCTFSKGVDVLAANWLHIPSGQ